MNILEDENRLSILEEIDNYLGCYGWHLKINDDIETFSFKDDIIVEYYHGLDYPWCIYHLDEFYDIEENELLTKIKEIKEINEKRFVY